MNKLKKHGVQEKIKQYWPLLALIIVAGLAACAINHAVNGGSLAWMHFFMGFLFCQFALLKLFDIQGFADGFQMYDIVAKKVRAYALAYPFLELILGLAYLSFLAPPVTYMATILLMAVGTLGVVQALQKGLDTYCSCMGTALKVPLSTVTLIENLGMGVMAFLMLMQRQPLQ